jgi:TPR repeat protein
MLMKSPFWLAAATLVCCVASPSRSDAQTVGAQAAAFDSHLTLADWDYDHVGNILRLAKASERQNEIETAAAAGNADALTLSGLSWFFGRWGTADQDKGWGQILEAANKGHVRAMAIVGILQWEGTLVPVNKAEALTWLHKAADAGSGLAQGNLAVLISGSDIERRPNDDPVKLIEAAAEKGIAWAAQMAGNVHADGIGTAKNEPRAREYYARAARLGDLNGLTMSGLMSWTAKSEAFDARQLGLAKMELAARSGQIDAMNFTIQGFLGTLPHGNLYDSYAALDMAELARAKIGSKNPNINTLLAQARTAAARDRSWHGESSPNQWPRKYQGSSKAVVDGIKIKLPPWPDGIPAPILPSIKGDRSMVDEWGVSEREWRELSAEQFTAFVARPSILQRVADGYAKRDPKALTLIALVAHATSNSVNFDQNYPQCQADAGRPAYCSDLSYKLLEYLKAAGIAAGSDGYAGPQSGYQYTTAIADYLAGQPSMRAQLESHLQYGLYNDHQRGRMLVFADLGYLPAIRYLESKSGACGGNSDILTFLARSGRTQRKFVDAALALGDTKTVFEYGRQLRDASCLPRDSEGALKLFRAAADLGNIDAKYELMMMYGGYGSGNYSPKYREAVRLAEELQSKDSISIKPELLAQFRSGAANETARRGAIGDVTDDPSRPPNPATIRAVVLREQRWMLNSFSGISFMDLLGNAPTQSWNYDDGSFLFESPNPADMFAIYYRTDYFIGGASCKPVAGLASSYDCSFSMSGSMDYRIGKLTLVKSTNGTARQQKHRFEFSNGEWRSASLRAEMMANMPTNGIGAGGGKNNNGLCKSLYAGVVAVGGKSTDKSLDPSTWGC